MQVTLCILAISSLPALIMVAASMGNAVQVFRQFQTTKRYSEKRIRNSMDHLRRQKLIEHTTDKDGKTFVRITRKGEIKLKKFSIELIKIHKPKKWDGKWRLVMFDIPIRFTKGREALRYHLRELGFYQFQKSAWIYPYPCKDEIIFVADFYGLSKYMEVLTVESILRDEKMRKTFGLPCA